MSLSLPNERVYRSVSARSQGMYMVPIQRWKYLYSAPDRKAFLFDPPPRPRRKHEVRRGLGLRQGELRAMRLTVLQPVSRV